MSLQLMSRGLVGLARTAPHSHQHRTINLSYRILSMNSTSKVVKYSTKPESTISPTRSRQASKLAIRLSSFIGQSQRIVTWFGSLVLVGTGAVITFVISYGLFNELWSPSSNQNLYNSSIALLKTHPKILKIFGDGMTAHGDPRAVRRRRRSPSSIHTVDKNGNQITTMVYYLEGDLEHDVKGTVKVTASRKPNFPNNETQSNDPDQGWQYHHLIVEVPGEGLPSKRFTIRSSSNKLGGLW